MQELLLSAWIVPVTNSSGGKYSLHNLRSFGSIPGSEISNDFFQMIYKESIIHCTLFTPLFCGPIEIKKRRSRYRKILLRALKPILETNKIRVEVMHQLNKIRVKVMCQLTSVFFLYRAQCFLFLISNALLDFEPSLHKILIWNF